MKKLFGFAVLAVVLIPATAVAAEFRFADQPSVRADEKITNDVYMAGGNVTSAGSISGDLVTGGGNIVVSGPVGADILVGGGNVSILSSVADDVRVGGGTIVLQGAVGGDVVAGGGQITIGGPGIGGDVAIGGGTIRIDAPVRGSVRIGGGSVYINAPITGPISIEADTVTLGSAAVISGEMTYKASKELIKEDGATVNGKVTFTQRDTRTPPAALLAALVSVWVLGKFLALLVSSLIIGLVFRRFSMEVVSRAAARPWFEMGRGLIVLIALPALSLLVCITLVGIPFGILGLISFIALMVVACITTPIITGSLIHRYFYKGDWEISWKTILLGAFVYSIIGLVPFVGWLVQTLIMLLALGTIAAIKWEEIQEWR